VADTTGFFTHFAVLPDPRVERTKKHRLIDLLFIGVCTVICKKAQLPKSSVRRRIKKAGWDNSFLETILVG